MYIPNNDTQNYSLYWLQLVVQTFDAQLNEPPIKIQPKSQKLLSQRIRICYYKTLGTSVIKFPMSPPSLIDESIYFFICCLHVKAVL